jgi:murein DD-endopeptidase MepM/ murein hydrolase activator NlpD
LQFATKLQPAFEFFKTVASGIVSGIVGFIDSSYKAYDFVKGKIDEIIGPDKTNEFDQFTKNLNTVLNGALLAAGLAAIASKKKGPLGKSGLDKGRVGLALGAAGAAGLYASRYTFRTVKDTAPAFQTRLSNMLLRGSMGLPAAKELPTRELLKRSEFAVAARKPKEIAKTIVVGADEVNTLRRAGVGTLTRPEQDEINSVKRKIGKQLGLTDRQISNAFVFRDLTPPKKPKTISSTQILGQTFGTEIARIKNSFMKLGYQPTDLIKIANDVDGQDYFTRKAAYDILVKKGKADRVFNIPSLESILPRPADRVAKVAEPTTFEKYIRKMQESGRSVDPMLTGAAGDRAAQRAGALEAEELVGGKPETTKQITRATSDPTGSRTPSKLKKTAARSLKGVRGAAIRNTFKSFLGPLVGGVLDFLLSVLFGDPAGLAAAGAIGATIGSALGAVIGGALIPVVGGFIGGAAGGIGGDLLGRFVYENYINRKPTDERLKKLTEFINQDKKPAPAKALLPKEDEKKYFGVDPVVTGRFGEKRGNRYHGGTDIAAPTGTPLVPVTDAIIVDYGDLSRSDAKRGDPDGWGNFIVYQDNTGLYHLYGHLNSIVKKSGSVKKGEKIATVGNTGRSSGPHLHWELGTAWTGSAMEGKTDPLNRYSVMAPFALKGGQQKVNVAPPNRNVASGLDDMTDYEKGGDTEIALLPIVDQIETMSQSPSGGDVPFVVNSPRPSIFSPALIG